MEEYIPGVVSFFVEFVHFTWLGGSGHDSYLPDSLHGVFGLDFRRRNAPALLVAALVLVVLLTASMLIFIGMGRAKLERLPAKTTFGPLPQFISSLFWGLCLAGYAAVIIEATTGNWIEVVRFDGTWGKRPFYSSGTKTVWPSLAIVVVGGSLTFILAIITKRRRERYWQLERASRGVLFAAFGLVLISGSIWMFGDTRLPRGFDYHAIRSADFAAWTCLVWALGCRTVLLFRLKRYEVLKIQHRNNPECFACGYNLRGSVMAGSKRCPECGVSIPRELFGVDMPPDNSKTP